MIFKRDHIWPKPYIVLLGIYASASFLVCIDGFYNTNCTEKCGHCLNKEPCDKKNGSCSDCQANFKLLLCKGNHTLMIICEPTNLEIYIYIESCFFIIQNVKTDFTTTDAARRVDSAQIMKFVIKKRETVQKDA